MEAIAFSASVKYQAWITNSMFTAKFEFVFQVVFVGFLTTVYLLKKKKSNSTSLQFLVILTMYVMIKICVLTSVLKKGFFKYNYRTMYIRYPSKE